MGEVVAPTREDPFARGASEVIGGPLGRHARTGGHWFTPVRVMLALTILTCAAGLLQKDWCRDNGWAAPGVYSHSCYSDIPPLYGGRGLAGGEFPYIGQPPEHQVEYPVLTGLAMWLTAQFVPADAEAGDRALWYFDINALALALCALLAVWATARTHPDRPWDALPFALAPTLALAGTINWDLYAVALLALGVRAWTRGRPIAAGVLIGLATAAKFYPLFVLGPLLLLCLRTRRMPEYGATVAGAACAWGAVNVPFMVADFDGWFRFYQLSQERGAGFGSIWLVLSQQGFGVPEGSLNLVAGGLFAACCAGIAALILRAPVVPRLAQVSLLVIAAFLLTNKVYSPQYVLWLLPFAVLARPRWRDLLIWQAGEIVHFVGTWMLLVGYPPGKADRALGEDGYAVVVVVHILATLWLVAVVLRDIWRPEHDPVRADREPAV